MYNILVQNEAQAEAGKKIRVPAIIIGVFILLFLFTRGRQDAARGSFHLFPSITPTPTKYIKPSTTPTATPTPLPTATPEPTETPAPTASPTPSPTPTAMPATAFEGYFDQYSQQYGVSKDLLKKIAFCESGVGPGAKNGDYGGMYQFTAETWTATRAQMGADTNPDLRFGAKEAIETAAFKISRGGVDAWANCK